MLGFIQMIIGPFWCEQSDSWLRIVMDDEGSVFAEMAKRDKTNPDLTTGWRKEDVQDFWVINCEEHSEDSFNDGLRLFKGTLYRTDFTKSSLTQNLNVRVYDKTGESISYNINKEKNNPFEGKSNESIRPSIFKLPLTPEVQLEQERHRQEQYKSAQELKLTMWQDWQKKYVHVPLDLQEFSTFDDNQTIYLYQEITNLFVEFSSQNYNSVEDYQLALEQGISNHDHALNKAIINLAAETHFDREHGLNLENSEQVRDDLYKRKQSFFYKILEGELIQLRTTFQLEPKPIQFAPLKSLHIVNNPQPINPAQPEDEEIQRALFESLLDQQAPINEDQDQLQETIRLSLLEQQPVQQKEMTIIHQAVSKARTKYQQWYRGEQAHRGADGFFSRFRHGEKGQHRAQKLELDVSKAEFEESIQLVNALLTDDSTRYHRHSLASFLLDELKELNGLPWEGLKPDTDSNLYDQKTVSDYLRLEPAINYS